MQSKYVSIIIPTHNDWNRLSLCVGALSIQTYPKESFEVIIVNNNPNDAVPENFLLPNNFKLIVEGKPGSYAARNTALKIAKGEIIGFTDSDCIPEKDWIKNAVEYLNEHKECSRIAGNILVFSDSAEPTLAEKYDMIYAFPQKKYAERWNAGTTANMFTYKYIFDKVGGFDDKLMSGGDFYWGGKAHDSGFLIHYVEDVKVYHPARKLKDLIKKEKRVGGGKGLKDRGINNKFSNFLTLINGFRPKLAEIKFVYTANTDLNAVDKIKILLLRHYLLNVRALEILRVQLGKKPRRY